MLRWWLPKILQILFYLIYKSLFLWSYLPYILFMLSYLISWPNILLDHFRNFNSLKEQFISWSINYHSSFNIYIKCFRLFMSHSVPFYLPHFPNLLLIKYVIYVKVLIRLIFSIQHTHHLKLFLRKS